MVKILVNQSGRGNGYQKEGRDDLARDLLRERRKAETGENSKGNEGRNEIGVDVGNSIPKLDGQVADH